MDQLAQRVFIRPEAVRGIEGGCAGPAHRAAAVEAERIPVQERSAAAGAEEIGSERPGAGEAGGTYGDSCEADKILPANPALIGEEKGKKSVRNPAVIRRFGSRGTFR